MKHLFPESVRPVWFLSLLLAVALLVTACTPGQIPESGAGSNDLAFEITESAITGGSSAAPGVTTISFNNTSQAERFVTLARLNTDVTFDQFLETLSTDDMAAVSLVRLGGGRDAPAGETRQFVADLKEGTYVVISFPESDAPPLTTSFEVSGSPTGAAAPDSVLTVDMVDFAFVMPGDIPSGQQTWEFTNSGEQWHEMVILQPAPGVTQEQLLEMFMSDEEPQGEPPFDEVGSFAPMSEGERAWLPLNLEPGTYMAVCFLPDLASTTGESHLEKGMIYNFEVGQ